VGGYVRGMSGSGLKKRLEMEIRVKRVYEDASRADGLRVLVDRLWPRGLSKSSAKIDLWAKEIAPSNELRKWYGHDPDKWHEFKRRYFMELDSKTEDLESLWGAARAGTVTFLYGAKEPQWNNATALKEYVEARLKTKRERQ